MDWMLWGEGEEAQLTVPFPTIDRWEGYLRGGIEGKLFGSSGQGDKFSFLCQGDIQKDM